MYPSSQVLFLQSVSGTISDLKIIMLITIIFSFHIMYYFLSIFFILKNIGIFILQMLCICYLFYYYISSIFFISGHGTFIFSFPYKIILLRNFTILITQFYYLTCRIFRINLIKRLTIFYYVKISNFLLHYNFK